MNAYAIETVSTEGDIIVSRITHVVSGISRQLDHTANLASLTAVGRTLDEVIADTVAHDVRCVNRWIADGVEPWASIAKANA